MRSVDYGVDKEALDGQFQAEEDEDGQGRERKGSIRPGEEEIGEIGPDHQGLAVDEIDHRMTPKMRVSPRDQRIKSAVRIPLAMTWAKMAQSMNESA